MATDQHLDEFSQKYSVLKVLGCEISTGVCSVLPLTPRFSDGLVYTAFWYTPAFFPILVGFCAIGGIIFLLSLPMAWRAVRRLPAIVISDGVLTVYTNYRRSAELTEIIDVQPQFGNALIKLANGNRIIAPLFFCRQPSLTLQRLQALPARGVRPLFAL